MLLQNKLNNSYLTYCTNIHAAEEWPDVITKLKLFLPKIKKDVSIDKKFGLGLRLAASAAKDLTKEEKVPKVLGNNIFAFWLCLCMGCVPYGKHRFTLLRFRKRTIR